MGEEPTRSITYCPGMTDGTTTGKSDDQGARSERGWFAEARQLTKRLGPAAILGLWSSVMPPLGAFGLLYAMAATNLGPWLRSHGLQGAAAYSWMFALLAGMSLLPTYMQSALGGFAFGITIGLPAALLGFAGGAVIGYEIALRASGDRVMKLMDERPKWRAVRDALAGTKVGGGGVEVTPGFWKTLGMVALLRLPPNSPFALTNLVMASVRVPRLPFLLGTIVGMLPRSALAVVIGAGLSDFSREALKKAAPGWVWIASIAVAIAVVVVISSMASKAVAKFTAGHPGAAA